MISEPKDSVYHNNIIITPPRSMYEYSSALFRVFFLRSTRNSASIKPEYTTIAVGDREQRVKLNTADNDTGEIVLEDKRIIHALSNSTSSTWI